MISSVSRAVALVTTPTQPRNFHDMILFEPIEPTSASGASSMTRADPLRRSGMKGSGEYFEYHSPTHLSNSAVGNFPAGGFWLGTYRAVTAMPMKRCLKSFASRQSG